MTKCINCYPHSFRKDVLPSGLPIFTNFLSFSFFPLVFLDFINVFFKHFFFHAEFNLFLPLFTHLSLSFFFMFLSVLLSTPFISLSCPSPYFPPFLGHSFISNETLWFPAAAVYLTFVSFPPKISDSNLAQELKIGLTIFASAETNKRDSISTCFFDSNIRGLASDRIAKSCKL